MAQDIHKNEERYRRDLENILDSEEVSDENKEDVKEYLRWLEDRELSGARKARYLQSAKQVLEYNDFRLKDASEEQVRKIHRQIQRSAYYHREYTAETKGEYKKFLRSYLKWANGGHELPDKAEFISATVSESVKDRTRPQDLPGPEDIKFLCQELDNLRDRAILLTQWDLGSRIAETLSTKVGDYFEEDGAMYIYVRGNKSSPNRKARVVVAPPAIDRWLEKGHPNPEDDDAYLFCHTEPQNGLKPEEIPYRHASYSYLARKLREIRNLLDLDSKVNTHAIRKARITFLKALGVPEATVDKRVGHVVGSDVTREYTRLDDTDSNQAYAEAYGEEDKGNDFEDDLLPLTCEECDATNPGYRDRCYECNGLLQIKELKQDQEPVKRAKELVWRTLEEKGITEEILEDM